MTILTEYDKLVARINALTPESQAQWGTMNVQEMFAHLRIPIIHSVFNSNARDLSTFFSRNVLRYRLLYFMKQMPRGIRGPREADVKRNGTTLLNFEEAKAKLLAAMLAFKDNTDPKEQPHHPFFGKFNRKEWARFHYLHIDHHLRQFEKP